MSMYHEGGERQREGERSCTLVVYRDELKRIRIIYDCTPSHTMSQFPHSQSEAGRSSCTNRIASHWISLDLYPSAERDKTTKAQTTGSGIKTYPPIGVRNAEGKEADSE